MNAKVFFTVLLAPLFAWAGTVTIKGSDTMVILAQRWAEVFMQKNPKAKIQVTGGGTGTGMAALLNGTTDIATASRAIKPAEKQKLEEKFKSAPTQFVVAKDGVAFYVHPLNPIAALTSEQLQTIYFGDVTDWKDVGSTSGRMVVYSRENSSGTYEFVKEKLLKGDDFGAAIQTLPGTAAVVNAVSKEKNAIGYGGGAYGAGVKELRIRNGKDEVAPTVENIRNGKYPFSRDLYFYVRGKPSSDIQAFIDFCLSKEGQEIVNKVGYFSIH